MKKIKVTLLDIIKLILLLIFLLVLYIGLIIITNGYWGGKLAGGISLLVSAAMLNYMGRTASISKFRRYSSIAITLAFLTFVIYTVIPVANIKNLQPLKTAKPYGEKFWGLKTGSKIAYYKLEASDKSVKKSTPIIFLCGGPGAFVRKIDLAFFESFTAEGYDVYLYDQAGSGRSGLLPKTEYSHERNIKDFEAIMAIIGSPKYVLIGQSYGGSLLASIAGEKRLASRISKAIYAEPGIIVKPQAKEMLSKSNFAGKQETASMPLRLFIGLIVNPRGNFSSQIETINFFIENPNQTQLLYANAYPEKDSLLIPKLETGRINFAANRIIVEGIESYNQGLQKRLALTKIPSMLLLGESSYVDRNAPMDLLRINPYIERTHYFKNNGHLLWNGLHGNNQLVKKAIDDFLDAKISRLPNYPTKADIGQFLTQQK